MERLTETVHARGHGHVQATHDSTFEVTTDDWLTPAGDCIVGVEADRAPADFDEAFVDACRSPDARIEVTLSVAGAEERVVASGHPDLTFESDRSLVVQTSEYVDDRTVAVGAKRGATGLNRALVERLDEPVELELTLRVGTP